MGIRAMLIGMIILSFVAYFLTVFTQAGCELPCAVNRWRTYCLLSLRMAVSSVVFSVTLISEYFPQLFYWSSSSLLLILTV